MGLKLFLASFDLKLFFLLLPLAFFPDVNIELFDVIVLVAPSSVKFKGHWKIAMIFCWMYHPVHVPGGAWCACLSWPRRLSLHRWSAAWLGRSGNMGHSVKLFSKNLTIPNKNCAEKPKLGMLISITNHFLPECWLHFNSSFISFSLIHWDSTVMLFEELRLTSTSNSPTNFSCQHARVVMGVKDRWWISRSWVYHFFKCPFPSCIKALSKLQSIKSFAKSFLLRFLYSSWIQLGAFKSWRFFLKVHHLLIDASAAACNFSWGWLEIKCLTCWGCQSDGRQQPRGTWRVLRALGPKAQSLPLAAWAWGVAGALPVSGFTSLGSFSAFCSGFSSSWKGLPKCL